jgi:DNA (cytosine-5)-methyltransferase 1
MEPVSRFHKLDPAGICNTIRAGTASDHGAFTSPRPIHPFSPRCITVREAARLHSYPDWFRFHVTKWHGFRQIGNSVPPLLARAVAAEVSRAFATPRKPDGLVAPRDARLLSLNMSEAAAHFGVATDVVPRRTRPAEGDEAGG